MNNTLNKDIKYPFPTAAIFLFVSSLFYFINLFTELPSDSIGLTFSCLFRFISVVVLGVFLFVKRVPVGILICIGGLLFSQVIEAISFSNISGYYLSYEYDGLIFLQNLFIVIAIVFIFLLALTNVVSGGFKKFRKVWFVGIILSVVAYFIDFCTFATISEFFPVEVEDIIIGNFLGNIFLCVACCLMPRWFKDVAERQSPVDLEIATPVQNLYEAPSMPVYDPYAYIENKEPAKQNNEEIETLRKYKTLYDEGVITEEEFEQKKKQIMNI